MKSEKIIRLLSEQRLRSYLSSSEQQNWTNDEDIRFKAIELYKKNITAYQFTYPALHVFEVVLRNAMHQTISTILQDDTWVQKSCNRSNANFSQAQHYLQSFGLSRLDTEKTYRMLNTRYVHQKTLKNITDAATFALFDSLKNSSPSITVQHLEGKIISKVSFGFWVSLLNTTFINTLPAATMIKGIFPNAPASFKASSEVDKIRIFRNDVFHHKPFLGNIEEKNRKIWEIVGYICDDCKKFFHPYEGR